MDDHTGITATTVTVGNVTTLAGGLFKGGYVGAQAYADYINGQGGVNGRKIVVDSYDDGYTATGNKQMTQQAIAKDTAMVGSFSLYDNNGGQLLKANPSVPNVSVTLDPETNALPNTYSPVPLGGGWEEGPLIYFQQKHPDAVKAVGALIADQPSAVYAWNGEKATMQKLGYNILYDNQFDIASGRAQFIQFADQMKAKGVKMVFLEQQPVNYAGPIIQAFHDEGFNPIVVVGASTYSNDLVSASGGPANTNGYYLEQNASLYLNADKGKIPSVDAFNAAIDAEKAKTASLSDFQPDLFTLYGYLSMELFVQALKDAGNNPSRGSILQALHGITSFSGDNIVTTSNPSAKTMSNCYLLAQINSSGQFQRLDDPSIDSSTHGYRCDHQYYVPPKS